MFSNRTHAYFRQVIVKIAAAPKPQQGAMVVRGVLNLLGLIYRESQGRMNLAAAYPAAVVLMCEALEYMEAATGMIVTKPGLAWLGRALHQGVMQLFRIGASRRPSAPVAQAPAAAPTRAQPGGPAPQRGGMLSQAGTV
ncbi:MAG: hypothetical protein KGI71_05490 [Patescibacteria group bacterium]|nr:hypothetical protein [Patescibacteria group bacterium]